MREFKYIYQLSFYFIVLLIFVFGGTIQFLLGISNTFMTFFIVLLAYAIYTIYALLKNKIVLNKIVFFAVIYAFIIILSGLINKTRPILIILYLLFALLPLGVFLFSYINYKENFISFNKIYKLLFYISIIQLPILLIQRNFYSFLIQFNNSRQVIYSYDFMFGSFFIKSDHSLDIFILFIIANILFNINNVRKLLRFPYMSIIYLSATIFLSESSISRMFLIVLLTLAVVIPLYKKHKKSLRFKLTVIFLGLTIVITGYNIRNQEYIQKRLGGTFEQQISLKTAEKQYELGTAKRYQILIMIVEKIKFKWIGDGPYSYFNILTGKFKKTENFTQFIWTYFDLGFIGLIIIIAYLASILGYLNIDRGIVFLVFFGVIIVYSFYTTIYSDIAIMFSLMTIFNKKSNESSNNTISRLEEKL